MANCLYSAPIKISTKGRLDDNEYFNLPPTVEFLLNSELVLDAAQYEARKVDPTLNEKYFKSVYCLALVDGLKWRCMNRNIVEINESGDAKSLTDRKVSVSYLIPFPGTFAVIIKPRVDYLLELRMTTQTTAVAADMTLVPGVAVIGAVTDSMNEYIGMIYLSIAMIVCAMFFASNLRETEKLSKQKVQIMRYKKDLAITTDVDYCGQSVIEKLQENIRYVDNPMMTYQEDELSQAIEMNKESEIHDEQILQKQAESLKARSVFRATKTEAKQQKAAKKTGEGADSEDDAALKFNTNSLKTGPGAKFNKLNWKNHGRSPNGMFSINMVDLPEEDDVLGEENGGNTQAPIQEEPEVQEVEESPVEVDQEIAQEETPLV